jgi:hypothetical protein
MSTDIGAEAEGDEHHADEGGPGVNAVAEVGGEKAVGGDLNDHDGRAGTEVDEAEKGTLRGGDG